MQLRDGLFYLLHRLGYICRRAHVAGPTLLAEYVKRLQTTQYE